jgi:Contractile injection system tube protein
MTLTKATLKSLDTGREFEFMFNPTQLIFEGITETAESPGARTEGSGKPKVNFSHIKPYKMTINNIVFDTYETQEDVVKKYISFFQESMEFAPGKQRTPIYRFSWGKMEYFRCCVVEKISYKLTMFLPNGTPVRAVIDSLYLKESDELTPNKSLKPKTPTPEYRQGQESLDARKKRQKSN